MMLIAPDELRGLRSLEGLLSPSRKCLYLDLSMTAAITQSRDLDVMLLAYRVL